MGGLFSSEPKRVTPPTYHCDTPPSRTYYYYDTPRSPIRASANFNWNVPREVHVPPRRPPSPTPQFLQAKLIIRNYSILRTIMKEYPNEEIGSIEMHPYETKYSQIQILFKKTAKPCIQLKSVKRINNPFLESIYELKKLDLKLMNRNLQEVLLFHGTPSVNVEKIIMQNLNYRYCGNSVGCIFGKGVSFTPFSFYASHYCNKNEKKKEMYLCRVLKGNSHIGRPGLVLPEEGYDTTEKENGHVVVKFHDDVYFPQFLISFEKNESEGANNKVYTDRRSTRTRRVSTTFDDYD